jgi:hypothetical protein
MLIQRVLYPSDVPVVKTIVAARASIPIVHASLAFLFLVLRLFPSLPTIDLTGTFRNDQI